MTLRSFAPAFLLVSLTACDSSTSASPDSGVPSSDARPVEDSSSPPDDDVAALLRRGCAGDAASSGTSRPPTGPMHAIGDSILGWNQETQESIPDFVGQQLGVEMLNRSTGGATLLGGDGIGSQYESGTYSHVILNGGGNDFATGCSAALLDSLISDDLSSGAMVDAVNRVTADGAQAVLMGYFIPIDLEIGCPLVVELMRRYRRLGEAREDVVYVCTLDAVTPSDTAFYADNLHPSPMGSAAAAQRIAATLRGEL